MLIHYKKKSRRNRHWIKSWELTGLSVGVSGSNSIEMVSSELDRESVRMVLELWQQTRHPTTITT